MPYIKVTNGTNLFYKQCGSGAPILFVHGWCQNTEGWEYMLHHLTGNGFRCIVYDQRGCGRSDHPPKGYDYHTLAEDLAMLIQNLELDKVVLVGHSMGCGVITQYLANYGDTYVTKAVFLGTITPNLVRSTANPGGIDRANIDAAVDFIKRDRPGFVYSLLDDFFGPQSEINQTSSYLGHWIVGQTLQASARAAVEMQLTVCLSNQMEELKSISLPVLILHGDKDTGPVELTAKRTHELLINSKLIIYEGRHHGMYLTEPELLAKGIMEFITE